MPCDCEYQLFTLQYNSNAVGDYLAALTINPEPAEEVRKRHNFWSSVTLIDAGYPAFYWNYVCQVYASKASRAAFVDWYVDLIDMAGSGVGNLSSLKVQHGGSDVIDAGSCAFAGIDGMQDPESLLWYPAGIVTVKFVGTTKPTVTT